MINLYPTFVAFILVFLSELGDKTQLLILSFSSKLKTTTLLIGVALGSLFSHGLAILFGSAIGMLDNPSFHFYLKIITYTSFIIFGLISLFSKSYLKTSNDDCNAFRKFSKFNFSYCFIIAISIAVGELGDKTFLASIGLGIQYPTAKLFLILGAISGMVISDYLAIILGKFLNSKISEKTMSKLSGIIFIIFGILGFLT